MTKQVRTAAHARSSGNPVDTPAIGVICCARRPWDRGTRWATAGRQRRRPSSRDRKSTRLNSSHLVISYAVFCLKKKMKHHENLNMDAVGGVPPAGVNAVQTL